MCVSTKLLRSIRIILVRSPLYFILRAKFAKPISEAANVRACRLAGAISRMSAVYQQGLLTLQRKRTGGNQQVTVKHIHQQVNVTQGGQAVVAGDKVMSRTRGRRRSDGGGTIANER